MKDLVFTVIREPVVHNPGRESYTPGVMYANGLRFCVTCEDHDRKLEAGGTKVFGKTAIPRGIYKLITSFSNRFQRVLPQVLDVPGFEGIRFHGGNAAEDSSGCILIGKVRTSTGIAQCADTVNRMIAQIEACEEQGGNVRLEVK